MPMVCRAEKQLTMHKLKLLPNETTFEVEADEFVLDAALRQGVSIPYSCRSGTCRSCIYQIIAGEVVQHDIDSCLITLQELAQGRRLLCLSKLGSDAVAERKIKRRAQESQADDK